MPVVNVSFVESVLMEIQGEITIPESMVGDEEAIVECVSGHRDWVTVTESELVSTEETMIDLGWK